MQGQASDDADDDGAKQVLDNQFMPALRERQADEAKLLHPREPEKVLPKSLSSISYIAGWHVGGVERKAKRGKTKIKLEEFVASLVKDSEEHYFEFRDRVGKTARPAMLKFMDQVVDATEPHIKKARLLVQREAGFHSARWALKDSNQLWLSWLDCLLDILGDPAPAASESSDEWDTGMAELAERLRHVCTRGKRTRLGTTAEDEKAARGDADLCTIRAIQVQVFTRQIWMVQRRRLAQLQAAMATTLARQAAHRAEMKTKRAAPEVRGAEDEHQPGYPDTSAETQRRSQQQGTGKDMADEELLREIIDDAVSADSPTIFLSMTKNDLRDMFEALGVQKPRGFSDMAKCELQELVISAYGISVPEEVSTSVADRREKATQAAENPSIAS